MALKIFEKFSPRANPADTDYPHGSIKNESVPGAKDGTPLDASWGNDMLGFTDALLDEAGITPNGLPDTVQSSQRLDAIKTLRVNDLSQSYEFETVTDMLASTVELPLMKKVEVSSSGVSYNVISSVGAPANALPSAVAGRSFLENAQGAMIKANQENDDQKDYLSCIPRCVGGTWELLNDAGHETLGVTSIEKSDDYRIRINYNRQYDQVNNLSITIDNELAPYGVFCGGNVGVAWSEWTAHAQLTGLLKVSDLSFTSTALITAADTTVTLVSDKLTLAHATAVNGDTPIVNPVFTGSNRKLRFAVGYGATEVNIRVVTDLAGLIGWNGSAFDWLFPTEISSSQSGISFTETNGVLRVNHPAAGSTYGIAATSYGISGYDVKVIDVSSTYFDIAFFDTSTGVRITTPDSNMKVTVHKDMDLLGVMPSTAQFLVRGPIVPIKSSNFSNIAGNNFWINGVMQKPLF